VSAGFVSAGFFSSGFVSAGLFSSGFFSSGFFSSGFFSSGFASAGFVSAGCAGSSCFGTFTRIGSRGVPCTGSTAPSARCTMMKYSTAGARTASPGIVAVRVGPVVEKSALSNEFAPSVR